MLDNPDYIFGFAFSLEKDGSPGRYNAAIADGLVELFEQRPPQAKIALQWEIADALLDRHEQWFLSLPQNTCLVITPPIFKASEINQLKFEQELEITSDWCRMLATHYKNASGNSVAKRLNHILNDANFFRSFSALQISNLTRPQFGELFTEHRLVPNPSDYENGLRRYQRMRANRLIIEAILSHEAIKRGQYLSTTGVIEAATNFFTPDEHPNIQVHAHPMHGPRCLKQISQMAEGNHQRWHLTLGPQKQPNWDPKTAQIWCRSQENWETYEQQVKHLMATHKNARKPK